MVWPFAGRIAATAVSPCTNLVAVALHNGNMVIWDKYLGISDLFCLHSPFNFTFYH